MDNTTLVSGLIDAANSRDWDALLGACTTDVSLIHPLTLTPYRGEDVRAFFLASAEALPDQYIHVDVLIASENLVAMEGRITATEEEMPLITPCAFFFTMRDGRVHQIRMYYDTAIGDEEE